MLELHRPLEPQVTGTGIQRCGGRSEEGRKNVGMSREADVHLWGSRIPPQGSAVGTRSHQPQRGMESLSEREDGMKSQVCAGVRGDAELEGECWAGLFPSPGRTKVSTGAP